MEIRLKNKKEISGYIQTPFFFVPRFVPRQILDTKKGLRNDRKPLFLFGRGEKI